jgi:hypothetical protein
MANDPEGASRLMQFEYDWNPRIVELAQLATALARSEMTNVQLELKVVLPSSDAGGDPGAIADEHAEAMATLLRAATNGTAEIEAMGSADEPLVQIEDRATLMPGQRAKVDGLDRRLELTLFRASPLDLDEEDEVELPDSPPVPDDPPPDEPAPDEPTADEPTPL